MAQSAAMKLGIKPQTTTLVLGLPLAEVTVLIGELPDGAVVVDTAPSADLVLFFADEIANVTTSARDAFAQAQPSGRFWLAYRKGARNRRVGHGEAEPLHRDTLQSALATLGLDGVTLIALDEVWSAMRVKAV